MQEMFLKVMILYISNNITLSPTLILLTLVNVTVRWICHEPVWGPDRNAEGRKGVIFGFSSISYYAMIRTGMRWLLLWEVLYRIFLYGPLIRHILFCKVLLLLISFPFCTNISYRYGSARSSASSLELRWLNP